MRDGTLFRHILNFLVDPEAYPIIKDFNSKLQLIVEARFYGVEATFEEKLHPLM